MFVTVSRFSLAAAVVKHFDDFHEDQFDFHSYCVRKVTLRAYTDVLKFEDNLWGEDYYFEAAEGTARIYLNLYDDPEITKENEEPDYSKMTAAERKKAKAIARKKRAQAEKQDGHHKFVEVIWDIGQITHKRIKRGHKGSEENTNSSPQSVVS